MGIIYNEIGLKSKREDKHKIEVLYGDATKTTRSFGHCQGAAPVKVWICALE